MSSMASVRKHQGNLETAQAGDEDRSHETEAVKAYSVQITCSTEQNKLLHLHREWDNEGSCKVGDMTR